MIVYFSLGSNLGNRLENLRLAAVHLSSFGEIVRSSDVFETAPWGGIEQPYFLNACLFMQMSKKPPLEILACVKSIERDMGRVKSVRWGARKIDIDILLADDLIFNAPELKIPHINMHERLFVLVPLAQIIPQSWRHPELGLSVQEMIQEISPEQKSPLRITKL